MSLKNKIVKYKLKSKILSLLDKDYIHINHINFRINYVEGIYINISSKYTPLSHPRDILNDTQDITYNEEPELYNLLKRYDELES